MGVDKANTSSRTRQLLLQIAQALLQRVPRITSEAAVFALAALERKQTAAVDEGLQTQRCLLAYTRNGKEERSATSSEDVTADGIGAVVGTQTAEAETAYAVGPAELEAVVYPARLGVRVAALCERVQETTAQAGGQGDARAAEGEGDLRLGFGLEM